MSKSRDLISGLREGINDQNLFKSVIFAGGPGSGKSFISDTMIAGLGVKVVNTDDLFEMAATNMTITGDLDPNAGAEALFRFRKAVERGEEELDPDIWFTDELQQYRKSRLKLLLGKRFAHWINGMLPVVVDGTGKDYRKIEVQREFLHNLGYDTGMVFVNTSLDVALERNKLRARQLPDSFVERAWQSVQQNIGKFQRLFGRKFYIVDNNTVIQKGTPEWRDFNKMLERMARKLLTSPLENHIGLRVIESVKMNNGKLYQDAFETDVFKDIDKGLVL